MLAGDSYARVRCLGQVQPTHHRHRIHRRYGSEAYQAGSESHRSHDVLFHVAYTAYFLDNRMVIDPLALMLANLPQKRLAVPNNSLWVNKQGKQAHLSHSLRAKCLAIFAKLWKYLAPFWLRIQHQQVGGAGQSSEKILSAPRIELVTSNSCVVSCSLFVYL